MDQETKEMFQLILSGMEQMEGRLEKKISNVDQKVDGLEQKIIDSELRMKVYLENTVTKRIDSLFDGYKLVHEQQWEMARKIEDLETRVERLEAGA